MPKQSKTSLNISDPRLRKTLQSMFLWVEHDFDPMHTRDQELATFFHLKSVGDSIASKFFSKSKNVKLAYHEMTALHELMNIYPAMMDDVARQINQTIHPHLQAYSKPPVLLIH